MAESFDAVIVGGGPSGSAAAILLARSGWSVALVEKTPFPRRKVCGEYVSATTLPLFHELGIEPSFSRLAGPPVREVGIFSGNTVVTTRMPEAPDPGSDWGRALGREHLDALLLDTASKAGARIWQPCAASRFQQDRDGCECEIVPKETRRETTLRARILIDAHGSWENWPTHPRPVARPSDLLGFKAHFRQCGLQDGLMPLLAFPGGYGGMVHTDSGRTSLSCCFRRDRLDLCRQEQRNLPAAESVLAHIQKSCRGVREALANAHLDGAWLAAGPIRPGMRQWSHGRCFYVGNAAGEAHPVIAEGISMAVQSAWLLCRRLDQARKDGLTLASLEAAGRDYARAWRQCFGTRLRASAVIAHWAMSPILVNPVLPILRFFPRILSAGARLAGKTAMVAR